MSKNKADLFSQLGAIRQEKQTDPSPSQDTQPPSTPSKRKSSGKRSDPDFVQVGAYIRKSTDKAVKRLLIEQDDIDFSDLVQSLLDDWIKQHPHND